MWNYPEPDPKDDPFYQQYYDSLFHAGSVDCRRCGAHVMIENRHKHSVYHWWLEIRLNDLLTDLFDRTEEVDAT